ncbi:hypothetical protein GQ457_11G021390 [Hibiscus cannabinus]
MICYLCRKYGHTEDICKLTVESDNRNQQDEIIDMKEIDIRSALAIGCRLLIIMSMIGENSDDLMRMSSSDESPKELEEVTKAPKNAKNKRKGKNTVEATSERGDAYHAECIYCHQKISCASSNGTNAMKRHTSRCKKAPFNVDTKQTILDFESKTKCNADGTIETVKLSRMVVVDELPFSFVEREGFCHFCKIAVPSFVPPSRATITRDFYALFIEKKKEVEELFQAVEKCLLECGLKRIMTITVDNASSNDLAIEYLKQILNLWNDSVLNAEFLHMRCAAHILKDGLKDVDVSVIKVRAAVKYVRSSPARLQKFKACVEDEKINSKSLVCLDIETRWNSTFYMLKSALVFRKAFKNLKTKYLPYTKELQKIFYETTLSFSGSRYVTSNTFMEEIYDIGYTINRSVDDINDGVKSMARQMKMKFDKYWKNVNNVNVLIFIALLLDPRHKLRYVEWIVRRSYDPSDSYDLSQRIKSTLTSLFDFFASLHPSSNQTRSCSFNPYSSGLDGDGEIRKLKGTNLRKDYVTEIELNDTYKTTIELDRYLGDKYVRDNNSFDILAWWFVQTNKYTILMSMSHDILAITVSTVASESAFSTG